MSLIPEPGVRRFGRLNALGLWTLYVKEVQRFVKVWMQTIVAPVVTSLLFLAVFSLALSAARGALSGGDYGLFIAPGVVMMAVIQNAFTNTSSSLMIAKIQGNVVDYLMPPLSNAELTVGWLAGGVTRGLVVGATALAGTAIFFTPSLPHPLAALYFVLTGSFIMSAIGVLAGIWADKFDNLAAVTNFVITPLAFLSGTFYPVEVLPSAAQWMAHVNPIFHMIDGFRFGVIGRTSGAPLWGGLYLLGLCALLWFVCLRVIASGWKLKA